jgi:hypothetical protein
MIDSAHQRQAMTSPSATRSLTDTERAVLSAVMDRLVPPIDDLPGAGTMGLVPEVEVMSRQHVSFHRALIGLLDGLAVEGFTTLSGAVQDDAIGVFETAQPVVFDALLEVVYLAYYGDERVHRRIGWPTGALQPRGFELPPFDGAILDKTRRREPFWRPIDR